MTLAVSLEIVQNKEVVPFGKGVVGNSLPLDVGDCSAAKDGPAEVALSVVGEAVMVDKIAPVAALARDSIETSEGILKYQKLKHLNHLQVEDYFICTCMHRDCISQAILLLENNLTIISAIKLEWLRRK